ncbi:MAG: hypothetical protein VX589_19435 [Myxococcota bacterium]|nr:hypothetical protein [Myxococcota bacterium]
MKNAWSTEEKSLLSAAKDVAKMPKADAEQPYGTRIIELARTVFTRAHQHKDLRKSAELVRVIKLFASDALFPNADELMTRIDLILDILTVCPQRPVLNAAAVVALDLAFDHHWTDDARRRERAQRVCAQAKVPVMGIIALESVILDRSTAAERLTGLNQAERRLRLDELMDVIEAHDRTSGLERLVTTTFETLFEETDQRERSWLVDRLMQRLEHRRNHREQGQWTVLMNPLLLHNRDNTPLKSRLIRCILGLPTDELTPYLAYYLATTPIDELDVRIVQAAARGGRALIPLLGRASTDRGFFGVSKVGRAATEARDTIVERLGVGMTDGGLSIIDVVESGGLTLTPSATSPLTMKTSAKPRARSRKRWMAITALVLAATLIILALR